jgi:SPP1 gp7 family putative phage head morphogenesis protein
MADPIQVKAFNVKFDEAIQFLKAKLPEATLKWDDLAGPVHAKVWAVAGATNADLLRDLQAAMVSAIDNGTTITQFRKDFDAAVQKYGWTYKGKRGWRTSVIFNNNMRSAHMAGRWKQLIANKDNRPYVQYRTAGDARVRPQHRQWNGLIFHLDDEFLKTHYPPNGWGCRCTVRAYSEADLQDKGLKAQPINDFKFKTRTVTSKDGLVTDQVPEGIDPGWDHNVGQSWLAPELALGEKLARMPLELRGAMVDKTLSPAFKTVLNSNFTAFLSELKTGKKVNGTAQIVGFFDSATIAALETQLPDLALDSTAVVVFDKKTSHLSGTHKATDAPAQVWPESFVQQLPEHFRNYRAVLWDKVKDTLFIVPEASFNETLPTIKIKLNQKTKLGQSAAVISLGSASKANLTDANKFDLMLGAIKK